MIEIVNPLAEAEIGIFANNRQASLQQQFVNYSLQRIYHLLVEARTYIDHITVLEKHYNKSGEI